MSDIPVTSQCSMHNSSFRCEAFSFIAAKVPRSRGAGVDLCLVCQLDVMMHHIANCKPQRGAQCGQLVVQEEMKRLY